MKAVLLKGECEVEIGDIPEPEPQEGDAVIQVKAVGLCGSGMGSYRGPRKEKPIPTGHEAAGIVADPRGAPNLKEGDRVVVLAVGGCGECECCKNGHMAYCEDVRTMSPSHCEKVAFMARCCLPIPDDMSFPVAIAVGGCGLGVGYHGVMRLNVKPDDFVVVMGVGPIGLSATLVLAHLGVKAAVVDVVPYRLELAEKLGAEFLINATNLDVTAAIIEANNGERPTKAILATSNHKAAFAALEALGPGGRMVTLGGVREWPINAFNNLSIRDRALLGSWHYHHQDFSKMMHIVESGAPVDQLVTHVFPFAEAAEAYKTFDSGQSGKVVLSLEE
ncbi:MAG: zinc-binding dehydrogenase [Planctomycetes bacterium]|nr:zinc-binding dehydrogenase [Planctomycetota bacterium]